MKHTISSTQVIVASVFAFFIFATVYFLPSILTETYTAGLVADASVPTAVVPVKKIEQGFVATHIQTPKQVKAIYMTSWVAGTPSLREKLVKIIDETEINTVVIDIKDYSGKIVFPVENEELKKYGSEEVRVKDMKEFIAELHKKGVYVAGRVAVFQDASFVKSHPDLAVKNKAGTAVWKDRKGISWIDAGSREYWDYIILVAKESHAIGFDEINFDYIRFPSDGNMKDISFPSTGERSKPEVLKEFFAYLHDNLKDTGVVTSADLFGMVTTATDDMGIGQILENALPYFDYIAPMVYPSHYPATFQGYKNPAQYPYEVVHYAMKGAVQRAELASTSPLKLRPWLQDFDLGADYGPKEVKAQIQATYDVGLDSWMLWSASNKYTREALGTE